MSDAFGNYVCDLWPVPAPYPASMRCCSSGNGAPDNANGDDGQYYLDLTNGDVYFKSNGTWVLSTGGGGGSGEILAYTTTGPTADGVLPSDLNAEAIAVKPDGTTFTWDSTLHVWDDV